MTIKKSLHFINEGVTIAIHKGQGIEFQCPAIHKRLPSYQNEGGLEKGKAGERRGEYQEEDRRQMAGNISDRAL